MKKAWNKLIVDMERELEEVVMWEKQVLALRERMTERMKKFGEVNFDSVKEFSEQEMKEIKNLVKYPFDLMKAFIEQTSDVRKLEEEEELAHPTSPAVTETSRWSEKCNSTGEYR